MSKAESLSLSTERAQGVRKFNFRTELLQNYPNPFNPDTWIPYRLAEASRVVIQIFDLKGKPIRRIDLGHKQAGEYITRQAAAYWDGRNDAGEKVASGLYFCSLQAGRFTDTRRLVVSPEGRQAATRKACLPQNKDEKMVLTSPRTQCG